MPGFLSRKLLEPFLDEVSGGTSGSGAGSAGETDSGSIEDELEEFGTDEGRLLAEAYGEHLVAGTMIAHKYSEGPPPSSRFITALGNGAWDSAVAVWYSGDPLTAQSDGSTPGYDFHRGTISTAINDATQGVSNVLPAGIAYNNTAYVATLLPEQYSTEDRPDKQRGRYKCKRIFDYNADGEPSAAEIYSVNPALVAADRIRKYFELTYPNDSAKAFIKFRDRINWSSWYAFRNYCAQTISWNNGTSTVSIPRFECHQAFTGAVNLGDALDAICGMAASWWQDDGEQISFHLPNDMTPVHHFHYQDVDSAGIERRSNIKENSFQLSPVDSRSLFSVFVAKFRDLDDEYLTESQVTIKLNGENGTENLVARIGEIQTERVFPPMRGSQARRLLRRQARIEAENRMVFSLTGFGDSFHVLPGDFVTVTHPQAKFKSQLALVVDASYETAEAAPDEVTFTCLKIDSDYLYSDEDHAPVQEALPSTDIAFTTTGLRYYFDARELTGYASGDAVVQLSDFSGRGNHATQATAGNRALYRTGISGVGGNACVEFTATDLEYYTLPNVLSDMTQGEGFVVVKLRNDPPAASLRDGLWKMGTDTTNANNIPYNVNGQIYDDFGSNARKTTGKNPSTSMSASAVLYNISSKANEWTMRINGAGSGDNYYQTTSNTVGFAATPEIGRSVSGFGNTYLDGYLCAILIYDRVLTGPERDAVEAELASIWGMTIA